MIDSQSNSKRIAKNTGMLYIRMFVMTAVGLFTARVILHVLGVSDYGIYNIIGGVVVLFSFINAAMTSATQRYLNFYIGRNDERMTSKVFSMSMNIYFILSAIFLMFAETVGLWFVNTQLNIPEGRMGATLWIYQFTVFSFMLNLTRVPYNASLIAYEKMDIYAYMSLLDVFLKLAIVYALYISPIDKLIAYGFLFMLVDLLDNIIYRIYCIKNFSTARYYKIWDKGMLRELFSFSGWSLFGSLANLLANQGLNILVNVFCGVTVNAAMGIANQISSKAMQFFTNFQVAFQPQIVKEYAAGEYEKLNKLVCTSSKLSFYLMLVISLPLILEMDKVLDLWLVEVPKYTRIFSQLILVYMALEALFGPTWMYAQATGKIKYYQILMSVLIFLNFPLAYLVLKIGWPVYWIWIVRIIVDIIVITARLLFMKRTYHFPSETYVRKAMIPALLVAILSFPIPLLILKTIENYWWNFLSTIVISLLVSCLIIYFVGLSYNERNFIKTNILVKLKRK